jgi:hypothetical protein
MSLYGKRQATYPKENEMKKGSGQNHETDPETLVKIEFDTINGKPFLGQTTDDELLYIWVKVFERSREELFGVVSTKSLTRNVRAMFKLRVATKLKDIFKSPNFSYEKYLDDGGVEVITGKILGYDACKPVEIGERTKVTVKAGFGVEPSGIIAWLRLFDTIEGGHSYVESVAGVKSDVLEVEITLKKHVNEYLPMYGTKAIVSYPGIPRMCNRCYQAGHLRRECNNRKRDWIEYVISLVEDEKSTWSGPGKQPLPDGKMRTQTHPRTNSSSFLFWNCASGVFNKKAYIEKYTQMFNPLVFFISECDLSPNHMVGLLSIRGYRIEVSKTIEINKKGHIMALIKDKAGITRLDKYEDPQNEIIVLKKDAKIIVGVYAGFKTFANESVNSNFDRLLNNLSQICSKFQKVLVGGDFNVDVDRDHCAKSKNFGLWIAENSLDRLEFGQTRQRIVAGSLQTSAIDHVFVKDVPVQRVRAVSSEASDHSVLVVDLLLDKTPVIRTKKQVVIDWRKFNNDSMMTVLTEKTKDIDCSASFEIFNRELTTSITSAMNVAIPKRVVHTRRETDIVNYHVEALKKRRDRLFKKARKTGCESTLQKVKELNLTIKCVIKRERARIIKSKMKDSSPTTFWTTVNTLLGRTQDQGVNIASTDGGFLPDDIAAQKFADFFFKKVMDLVKKNPIQDAVPDGFVSIATLPFTPEELGVAISSFKPKKSCGPDEIPMLILKSGYQVLKPFLLCLFERIVAAGQIPKVWKIARIKPIHKKGDKHCIENYRPISNLNSVSKIFERCILNRVNKLETDGWNQHGFKANHSTTTAALEIQDRLAHYLDSGLKCVLYSVDLSAAFDLIRPGMFIKKAANVIGDSGIVGLIDIDIDIEFISLPDYVLTINFIRDNRK